jgi:hypothetical protein
MRCAGVDAAQCNGCERALFALGESRLQTRPATVSLKDRLTGQCRQHFQ